MIPKVDLTEGPVAYTYGVYGKHHGMACIMPHSMAFGSSNEFLWGL